MIILFSAYDGWLYFNISSSHHIIGLDSCYMDGLKDNNMGSIKIIFLLWAYDVGLTILPLSITFDFSATL